MLLRESAASDGSALALITPFPAVLWGLAWVAVSIAVLALTLRELALGRVR